MGKIWKDSCKDKDTYRDTHKYKDPCQNTWTVSAINVDILNVNTGVITPTVLSPFSLTLSSLNYDKSKYLLTINYSSGGPTTYTTQLLGARVSNQISFSGSTPIYFDSFGLGGLWYLDGFIRLGADSILLVTSGSIYQGENTYSAVLNQKLF
jgi:hypothetical protein